MIGPGSDKNLTTQLRIVWVLTDKKDPSLFGLYPIGLFRFRLFMFGLSPFGLPMMFGLSPFGLF